MTVRDAIYRKLAEDPQLNILLARSTIPGAEGSPAIYEHWAGENTDFPYINITWTFGNSERHWIKRQGLVTFDIFTGNGDSTETETIQRRIIELLDHRQTTDPTDGYIETYLDSESDIPEETTDVVHWNLDFRVDHWRQGFIENLEKEATP